MPGSHTRAAGRPIRLTRTKTAARDTYSPPGRFRRGYTYERPLLVTRGFTSFRRRLLDSDASVTEIEGDRERVGGTANSLARFFSLDTRL